MDNVQLTYEDLSDLYTYYLKCYYEDEKELRKNFMLAFDSYVGSEDPVERSMLLLRLAETHNTTH